MKTEELIALGLNEDQAKQVFTMYGKDVSAYQKKISAMETERDGLSEQLKNANDTIAKYDGIDPSKYREEIEKYRKQAEDTERAYGEKLLKRDQSDWIGKKLDEYGVKSPYARRQLSADIMAADSGLKWKDGAFYGFDDFMKAAKENDNSLFVSPEEKAAQEAAAKEAQEKAKEQDRMPTVIGKTGGDGSEEKRKPPRLF